MSIEPLTAQAAQLLEERLPWYVNGTLPEAERAWVEQLLATSPAAAQRLQREQALLRAVPEMLQPAAQDVGLDRLMAQVRQQSHPAAAATQRPPSRASWWQRASAGLQSLLAGPAWATGLAAVVVVQSGVMGWLALSDAPDSGFRSIGVTEVRTLRVSFKPAFSEAQIRAALVRASARIVGGPTQVGEYWVASDLLSLDEIRASLSQSGVVATMETDLAGPRGQ